MATIEPSSRKARRQRRAPTGAAVMLTTILATVLAHANGSGLTPAEAAGGTIGSRHVFKADTASPFPPIGCWDHRALMYVVREMGDDAQAAQLFADRECRKLVPDAAYLKCGTGGFVHPLDSAPLPYSGYCRLGVQEIKLYVLDSHMPAAPAAERPER